MAAASPRIALFVLVTLLLATVVALPSSSRSSRGGGGASRPKKSGGSGSRGSGTSNSRSSKSRAGSGRSSSGGRGGGGGGGKTRVAEPERPGSRSAKRKSGGGGGGSGRGGGSSAKRRYEEEEDDFDDEYDDEYDGYDEEEDDWRWKDRQVVPARRGKGGPPAPRRGGRGAGGGGGGGGGALLSGLANAMVQKAKTVAEDGQGKLGEWKKVAKGMYSSQMEKFILSMTWPADTAPFREEIQDMVHDMNRYASFDEPVGSKGKSHIERVLGKIYARMREEDWRTTMKAILVLHCLSAEVVEGSAVRLRRNMLRLTKKAYPKTKGKENYFNNAKVLAVNSAGKDYQGVVKAYWKFCKARVVDFEGGGDRLEETVQGKESTEFAAVEAMTACLDAIRLGMSVRAPKGLEHVLTDAVSCYVALDLVLLWEVVLEGVQRLKQADFAGDDSLSPKKAKVLARKKAELEAALNIQDDLKKFLTYVNKVPKSKEAGGPFDIERLTGDQLSLAPVEEEEEEEEETESDEDVGAATAAPTRIAAASSPSSPAAAAAKEEEDEGEEGGDEGEEEDDEEEDEDEEGEEEEEGEEDEEEEEEDEEESEDEDDYDDEF